MELINNSIIIDSDFDLNHHPFRRESDSPYLNIIPRSVYFRAKSNQRHFLGKLYLIEEVGDLKVTRNST